MSEIVNGERASNKWNITYLTDIYPTEYLLFFFFFFLVFCFFRAAPEANGGSQVRGRIRAAPAGLNHSHSNARSKPCLRPTAQLTATPDP